MADTDREPTVASDPSSEAVACVSESVVANVAQDATLEVNKPQDIDPPGTARPPITTHASGSGSSPTVSSSQPKRFLAVNINKKFLEKNSSASSSSQPSPSSVVAKAGITASRPTVQPSTSHSRLVAAKLTAPQSSSTTGPGWSRPSSATPPGSSAPSIIPSASSPGSLAPGTAPQIPHAGKVIQPQARPPTSTTSVGGSQKEGSGSGKPAWGNMKTAPAPAHTTTVGTQNDFPTAAEVAQVSTTIRKPKPIESKEAEVAAAHKQARLEEADTFRGVHLDPNAHHWDEMEEDDDNFLDGVIEFGDGRQYKIEAAEPPQSSPPSRSRSRHREDGTTSPAEGLAPPSNVMVSKEERFADDFDRSWPRTKPPPAFSHREPPSHRHHPPQSSPISAHPVHSPQESRVLFNERSNRLEPYSNAHSSYRPAQAPFSQKRGAPSDVSISPTESRSGRDLPPHSQAQNVQLLQKSAPPGDFHPRHGGFGKDFEPRSANSERSWHRDIPRRDDMPFSPPSHGPSFDSKRTRDQYSSFGPQLPPGHKDRDRDPNIGNRGARLSNMGPPLSPRVSSRDVGRQMPPHLSQGPLSSQRRPPPLDPQARSPLPKESPISSGLPPPLQLPSHLQVAVSPTIDTPPLLSAISDLDMDGLRKDVMQTAAARAKERRKLEEEEREKERERARRKAAELDKKLKGAEAGKANNPEEVSEPVVNQFIEDAIKTVGLKPEDSVPPTAVPRLPTSTSQPVNNTTRRPPSLKGISRQPPESSRPRRTSQSSTTAPPTPAAQADSWRSKTSPHMSAVPRQMQVPDVHVFPAPPPSLLHRCDALTVDPEEELEVVDFSDLGKFIGVSDAPTPTDQEAGPSGRIVHPPRPTASDFFEDRPDPAGKGTSPSWRRKSSHDFGYDQPPTSMHNQERVDTSQSMELVGPDASPAVRPDSVSIDPISAPFPKEATTMVEQRRHSTSSSHALAQSNTGSQRTPRNATFKEANLSAWDDAMSRIKGALDGMQASDASRGQHVSGPVDAEMPSTGPAKASLAPAHIPPKSPKELRWIPPALRARRYDYDVQPRRETFDVTGCDPPRSPQSIIVQLPAVSRHLERQSKKQYHQSKSAPQQMRWDILSWDPPVEGMTRRDLSLNDVLFRKSSNKGKHKYRVVLPRSRLRPSAATGVTGPKVNLPANGGVPKTHAGGAFGRPSGVDGLSTWRKPTSPSFRKPDVIEAPTLDATLSTTSKSPPPDLPTVSARSAATPKPDVSISAKADGLPVLVRPRSQPKMPAGSAVAFYRDSGIDVVDKDPNTSVKFIVNSELDEPIQSQPTPLKNPTITLSSPTSNVTQATDPVVEQESIVDGTNEAMINGLKSPPTSPELAVPSLVQSKTESKSSDGSVDRAPITPPTLHSSTAWTKTPLSFKESPARPPDPEHLKAVWSQASDKAMLPAVNSLEGIADDLTALPFTLQDVKSEDGETPPPSIPSGPSRMSLHDVTRAFQQVPSSSSSSPSSHRGAPLSPTSSTMPLAHRPPSYTYALPPPGNNSMRQPFAPYSSSMMTAAPGSPMMYPHPMTPSPVPGRMPVNGLYSQSLWMPPPPPQNHNRMIRPVASPYSAPLISYPSPSTPTLYAPPLPVAVQNPPQQNGSQTRGRNMPVMSPVMSHASAHPNVHMYGASPVLVHAPVVQVPPGHAYVTMPQGRRNDNASGHSPMQQPVPIHSPHSNGYTSVPPASFLRPTW